MRRAALVTLLLLVSLGCNQTYTAAWAPMGGGIAGTVRPTDFLPERRIFLEVVAKLAPGRKVYDDVCADAADTGAFATGPCKEWLDDRALEMGRVLATLLEARQTTSEMVLTNQTPDWKTRVRDGDLKVRIIVADTFQRDFTWAFLFAWRSDTYRIDATVEVSDARTGRHLRTFDRSHRHDCGLNYLWLIYVFVPLIPFYLSNNENDRGEGAVSLAARLADDISDASNQAAGAPPSAPDPGIPAPRPPPAGAAEIADLSCIDSRIYVNNAELKGFPEGAFDNTPRGDLAEVFASGVQSAFFEAGVREVFTLVNLEQQLQKEKRKEILGCSGNSCVNQIIENFGLSESIFIVVTRMGDTQAYLNLTWMDTASETILGQQTKVCAQEITAILDALGELSSALLANRCPR
ncbi:MAG: hypothetical protein ABIK09_15055 [Pseudomonadota bacterium]